MIISIDANEAFIKFNINSLFKKKPLLCNCSQLPKAGNKPSPSIGERINKMWYRHRILVAHKKG